MRKPNTDRRWTCPHGYVTGFFDVPGHPNLIEYRSCGICCEEVSTWLEGGAKRDNITTPEKK